MTRRKTSKKKASPKQVAKSVLRKGITYLLEEEDPCKTFTFFKKSLVGKRKGLLFTRSYPPFVIDDFSLKGIPIYWLTRRKGENNIDPVQLNVISHKIQEFITQNDNTLVLLDGIEYMISQNDFKPVLRFIQHIRDEVLVSQSNLLITLSPQTLSRIELKLLERELEVLEAHYLQERNVTNGT
ncbi:MAG: DUF835 domain-containing protein [Candidatus Hodarchaeales archaeon]